MTQTTSQGARLHLLDPGINERKPMTLAAVARAEDVSVFVYSFIFHLPTDNYPGFLYYPCLQGQRKTLAIPEGSHQAAACHSRV